MQYMIEGGWGMWASVLIAVGVGGYGFTRDAARRSGVLFGGAFAVLLSGLLGMATGMEAVASGIAHRGASWPQAGYAVGLGLGELANNGTLSVALAGILALAAAALRPKAQTA